MKMLAITSIKRKAMHGMEKLASERHKSLFTHATQPSHVNDGISCVT